MTLYQRLDQAFKEAIKNQQPVAASTLRLLKSAIRYREVEVRRQLTEDELQACINTQAKQRREAIAEYTKANRPELAKQEEEELSVLLSFATATEPRRIGSRSIRSHFRTGGHRPQRPGKSNEKRHGPPRRPG